MHLQQVQCDPDHFQNQYTVQIRDILIRASSNERKTTKNKCLVNVDKADK